MIRHLLPAALTVAGLAGASLAAPAAAQPRSSAWIVTPDEDSCHTEIELTGRSGAPALAVLASDGQAIYTLEFGDHEDRMLKLLARRGDTVEFRRGSDPMNLQARLRDYFGGDLHALDRIPVNTGGTDFQQQVWKALRTIPPGETRSYGQLAVQLHHPKASRAVGYANSLNPVAIIVPCHRVIGASSALTGYAGGLERKRWLLRHERALPADLLDDSLSLATTV